MTRFLYEQLTRQLVVLTNCLRQFEEPGPAGLKKEMPEKLRKEIDMCKLDSRKVILGWLTENGFSDCVSESPESGAFIVHASIARIEKLLGATYETFGKKSSTITAIPAHRM